MSQIKRSAGKRGGENRAPGNSPEETRLLAKKKYESEYPRYGVLRIAKELGITTNRLEKWAEEGGWFRSKFRLNLTEETTQQLKVMYESVNPYHSLNDLSDIFDIHPSSIGTLGKRMGWTRFKIREAKKQHAKELYEDPSHEMTLIEIAEIANVSVRSLHLWAEKDGWIRNYCSLEINDDVIREIRGMYENPEVTTTERMIAQLNCVSVYVVRTLAKNNKWERSPLVVDSFDKDETLYETVKELFEHPTIHYSYPVIAEKTGVSEGVVVGLVRKSEWVRRSRRDFADEDVIAFVQEYYENEDPIYTLEDIVEVCDVSRSSILRWANKRGWKRDHRRVVQSSPEMEHAKELYELEDVYYTVKEIAEIVGLHHLTIHRKAYVENWERKVHIGITDEAWQEAKELYESDDTFYSASSIARIVGISEGSVNKKAIEDSWVRNTKYGIADELWERAKELYESKTAHHELKYISKVVGISIPSLSVKAANENWERHIFVD